MLIPTGTLMPPIQFIFKKMDMKRLILEKSTWHIKEEKNILGLDSITGLALLVKVNILIPMLMTMELKLKKKVI